MRPVQTQDLDKAWLMRKECRAKVNAEATPEAMHAAFQRLFPMPCRSRYVALCLLPQQPLLARLVCCSCCLLPYAFLIPYPQPWPLLLQEKVHAEETLAILSRGTGFQNIVVMTCRQVPPSVCCPAGTSQQSTG